MAINPPPPIPATTRPVIMVHSVAASPHIRFPRAKSTLLITNPALLEKISVSLPEMGWHAALAIRYADAIHDRRLRELKLDAIGLDRVAMIVESRAPRKTPTSSSQSKCSSFHQVRWKAYIYTSQDHDELLVAWLIRYDGRFPSSISQNRIVRLQIPIFCQKRCLFVGRMARLFSRCLSFWLRRSHS